MPADPPVLVVGAGPAGLTAAVTLARYGVPVRLLERRRHPSELPRATVISTRSMEILRSWGLEEAIRAGGVDVECLLWTCDSLAAAAAGRSHPVGYPTRAESAAVSPTGPACVPQDHLELVMLAHLRGFPDADVRLGTEVVGADDGPEAVRVTYRDTATGVTGVIRARYVVAADGAHSPVRRAAGVPMPGADRLAAVATILFRAPLWDLLGPCRYVIYGVDHPQGPGTFLPAGPGDRWRYGIFYDPAREGPDDYPVQRLVELVRLGAGVPGLGVRVERTGTYTFAARIAQRYRAGRILLAGDAAHRVTPRGGTGMNTAIADGYDLGWKLGWVLRGWAGPELLDSYEAERRPVAVHNVARSADPAGARRDADGELAVDLGGRVPHARLPGTTTSTLDLLGPGLTLFTGPAAEPAALPAGAARPPVAVRRLDPATAAALGLADRGTLLVRPDGVPTGACATVAPAAPRRQPSTTTTRSDDHEHPGLRRDAAAMG